MTGSRRSGIRIVIPPQSAEQPVRITCRQLRPDQVIHLPPLSEGEGLACRILQLTPASFLAPVLMEVPHFTPLQDNREIVVLRSDTGKKWSLHTNTTNNNNLTTFLATSINNLAKNNINNNTINITTITTLQLPQYFAIVSRPRQDTICVGPDGGIVTSQLVHQVKCHFPSRSLTKQINVGVSVFPIQQCFTQEILQQGGAVSSVITVEPRRRKFHKPITVTIPVPEMKATKMNGHLESQMSNGVRRNISNISAQTGLTEMNEDFPIETSLMLMCSMSGSGSRAVWEDVTLSTPLSFSHNCVQFTTVVSAQFWLLRLPAWMSSDKLSVADKIFRSASRAPYMARLWLFWRETEREDAAEVELRVVLVTEGERVSENTLEERENFTSLAKSDELDILDKSEIIVTISGNLEPVSDSIHKLVFRPFTENRTTLGLKRQEIEGMAAGKVEVSTDYDKLLLTKHLVFNLGVK